MSRLRTSRRAGEHRLGGRAPERPEGEDRRGRRRHAGYDIGPRPGRDRLELADGSERHASADLIDPRTFAELCRRSGIRPDDTVVFYGDKNNWFAAWALWQFKYHGHKDVTLMNGGRKKWELEGRPWTTEPPQVTQSNYPVPPSDEIDPRVSRRGAEDTLGGKDVNLVDVRSPDEFTGKILAPPGMTRDRPARRAHPRREEHPLGQGRQRRRHVQEPPTSCSKLYADAGVRFRQADDRLLPHRRAVEPHVVRAEVPARREEREELRWLVDGVGQPGRRPIEKGEGAATTPMPTKCE